MLKPVLFLGAESRPNHYRTVEAMTSLFNDGNIKMICCRH